MNRENKNILFIVSLVLIVLLSVYCVDIFKVKEDLTPEIRGLYNPNKRAIRLYTENIKKQATEYVHNLQKTFSWS